MPLTCPKCQQDNADTSLTCSMCGEVLQKLVKGTLMPMPGVRGGMQPPMPGPAPMGPRPSMPQPPPVQKPGPPQGYMPQNRPMPGQGYPPPPGPGYPPPPGMRPGPGQAMYRGGRRGIEDQYNYDLAGFWLRFVSYFIDSLISTAISYALAIPIGIVLGLSKANEGTINSVGTLVSIINFFVMWFYWAGFESSSLQGTPGKLALGLVVTDLGEDRISFWRASARNLCKILSGVLCAIGYIMAGFTENKQALHDMISGCLVMRRYRR